MPEYYILDRRTKIVWKVITNSPSDFFEYIRRNYQGNADFDNGMYDQMIVDKYLQNGYRYDESRVVKFFA